MYGIPDEYFATGFSVLASFATTAATIAAGYAALKQLKTYKTPDVGITPSEVQQMDGRYPPPFEVTALSNYYNQALRRANLAFSFSLFFASIGFAVIIFAFLSHSSSDVTGTFVKITSGIIIEAVSSLFFVQSANAQKSMSSFFDNLRLDRLNAEAREMIGEIESAQMRDELRGQLILKYSGVDRLIAGDIPSQE